jgi:hypothetical protein
MRIFDYKNVLKYGKKVIKNNYIQINKKYKYKR